MSVNDPLRIEEWHDHFILKRGNETFFNDGDFMIVFEDPEDARDYAREVLGEEVSDEARSGS